MIAAVVATCVGCYAFKLAGYLVPERVLQPPRVERAVSVLPIALLASLIVSQTFVRSNHLALDARAAGLFVAAVALAVRAPLALSLVLAVVATAAVRAVLHVP